MNPKVYFLLSGIQIRHFDTYLDDFTIHTLAYFGALAYFQSNKRIFQDILCFSRMKKLALLIAILSYLRDPATLHTVYNY